jgi:DNA segregation ATPase FtsK/SpoIIIE-like protein
MNLTELTTEAQRVIDTEHITRLGCSFLQRRFHINYQTAVHLMDMLELNRTIGPAGDDRFRHVLNQGGYSIFD